MAVFPRLARGDIISVCSPSNLLATVTDSKYGYPQVKHGRVGIFPGVSPRVFGGVIEQTYEEPLHHGRRRDLGTKSAVIANEVNKALTSAQDDSFGRPSQVLELGGAGQYFTEHIERSETSKD